MKLFEKFKPKSQNGVLDEQEAKKYFSTVALAVSGFYFAMLLSSSALVLLVQYILQSRSLTLASLGIWGQVISNLIGSILPISLFGFPLLLLLLKPLPSVKPEKKPFGFKQIFCGFCVAMLLMYVGSYLSTLALSLFSMFSGSIPTDFLSESVASESKWITLIFTGIIAPIIEELLFRKVLCDRLLPLGEGYAVFISAIAFALIHGNFYQVAYAFFVGAFFGYIYVKTGKIILPIIYHILLNILGTVVSSYIMGLIDTEALEKILEAGTIAPDNPMIKYILIVFAYECVLFAIYIVGLVTLWKSTKKGKLTYEKGLLTLPAKKRLSIYFCNPGVLLSVIFFACIFLLSLMPL